MQRCMRSSDSISYLPHAPRCQLPQAAAARGAPRRPNHDPNAASSRMLRASRTGSCKVSVRILRERAGRVFNSAVAPVVYHNIVDSCRVCFALRVASPARRRRRLRAPGARRARARMSHVACARGSAMMPRRGTRARQRRRNPYNNGVWRPTSLSPDTKVLPRVRDPCGLRGAGLRAGQTRKASPRERRKFTHV